MDRDTTKVGIITHDASRRERVMELLNVGWPRRDAEMAVDLAFQSVDKGVATWTETTALGHSHLVRAQALAMGAQLMALEWGKRAEWARQVLEAMGAQAKPRPAQGKVN